MKLVIVESPAKAKTIEKYLGKEYKVLSSYGHIRDLPSKGMNIDIENNFEPTYAVSADKKKVMTELKKALKQADEVILATDEDREGEAIAWHLAEALKLDVSKTKRIAFREITQSAIIEAIKSPGRVNTDLVDAQQARRILDRIVGYELSPILWKKVQRGLSAGRVQSVAVRLIKEREDEIEAFEGDSSYKLTANFEANAEDIPAELSNKKVDSAKEAKEILEAASKTDFKISTIEKKPGTRSPSAPFTTSTLQQEAARKLGYSVRQTMQLAQRLYEAGLITYMRTDSINLSNQALSAAATHIEKEFGKDYLEVRKFKTKNASAQEAHEAIRPTEFARSEAGGDEQQKKLYNLIYRRTLASQMAKARIEKTVYTLPIQGRDETFLASGQVLTFDGFIKVYGGGKDDVILPTLAEGDSVKLNNAQARQTFQRPPARYSEASLVRTLEELGIGRPSTYAPTISTIQDRGYVEKADVEAKQREVEVITLESESITSAKEEENFAGDSNKLLPTPVAGMVTDFLVENFTNVLDYDFTSRIEAQFDNIADGKIKWQTALQEFYNDFHPLVEKAENVSRADVSNMRELGVDPKDGKIVYARLGRFGPMLQKGKAEDQEEKPGFAPMPADASLMTVTLDQALEMFKLPRTLGQDKDGEDIKANIGRFGPYVQKGKVYASIKDDDPRTITLEQALIVLAEKDKAAKKSILADFGDGIIIKVGPYGPYITDGKKNARIPKDTDKPENITHDEAKELLAKAKPGRKRRKTVKKK